MTFTVNSLTRCSGLSHWMVSITVGAQTYTIHTSPEELQFDPLANPDATRDMVLARLRSAAKEGNAATFAAAKAFLEGKVYKL